MNGSSSPNARLFSSSFDSDPSGGELSVIQEELCQVLNAPLVSYLGERPGATAVDTLQLWRAHSPRFIARLLQRGWKRDQAESMSAENDRLADMLHYVIALQGLAQKDAVWENIVQTRTRPEAHHSRPQISLL